LRLGVRTGDNFPGDHTPHIRVDSERDAHALFATNSQINAPRLLGEGRLYDPADSPWPYLITARMSGVASWRADAQHLTFDIFHPLPAEISLEEIDTLDELSTELFAV
jgi:hypothetical protein